MSIKQHGGVFGRNPSFNSVEVENLSIAGNAVPDASTILVDGDIGSTVQGFDADTAKYDDATANFTGTLQNGGSNVIVDTDIGSTVQAYDADTAKLDVAQTFTDTQTFSSDIVHSARYRANGGIFSFARYSENIASTAKSFDRDFDADFFNLLSTADGDRNLVKYVAWTRDPAGTRLYLYRGSFFARRNGSSVDVAAFTELDSPTIDQLGGSTMANLSLTLSLTSNRVRFSFSNTTADFSQIRLQVSTGAP